MNLPDAMSSVYRNYATASGRAGRSEYWWYYLVNVTVYTVLWAVAVALSTEMSRSTRDSVIPLVWAAIVLLWWLVNAIPSITVTVRRLHDVGMSGWYYFLVLVPSVGSLVLFVITLLPGKQGSNMYGRDPRNANGAQARAPAMSPDFQDPRFGSPEPYRDRLTPTSALTPIAFGEPAMFATTPPLFPPPPPYPQDAPYVQEPPPPPPYVQEPPPPPPYVQEPPPPPPYVQEPPPPPPYVQEPPPPPRF